MTDVIIKPLSTERLDHLQTAAEVGVRMSALQRQTVHVIPEELASIVHEVKLGRAQVAQIGRATDPAAPNAISQLAQRIAETNGSPGAMIMMLDEGGGLHLGCAAVDHPIVATFVATAKAINVAIERGQDGFKTITREHAVEIARSAAKAKPESYYAEPFEPHEWVVDAIVQASTDIPTESVLCAHCKQGVANITDVEAMRDHAMKCEANPVVQELQRLRRIVDVAYHVAWRWDNRDVANIAGTKDEQLDDLARAFSSAGCPNCGRAHLEPHNVDPTTGMEHGPWGCPDCEWVEGQPIKTRGELLARIHELETARAAMTEAARG